MPNPRADEPLYGAHDVDQDAHLLPPPGAAAPSRLALLIHGQFRGAVMSGAFPCLGGASALRRRNYRFGVYPALGSKGAVDATACDLGRFAADHPASTNPVAVFVTAFHGPPLADEDGFERALWRHLDGLTARDEGRALEREEFVDPEDPGFVFASREFFIVGFHPASSRWARRFGWPVLVFNALSHSVLLLRSGKYDRMHDRILERDRRLQGFDNPSLGASQLAQFSGRAIDASWRCPGRSSRK